MLANNSDYLIDDGYGNFVEFDGIQLLPKRRTLTITFDNQSTLTTTLNHRVLMKNHAFIDVCKLKVGSVLQNNIRVVKIRLNDYNVDVFDVVNSETGTYWTDNVISHNCSFVGSSNTLIDSNILSNLTYDSPIDERNDVRYFAYPAQEHNYVMTVDVSRGRGLDYTAFSVIDITSSPYHVVCTFKNNTISPNVELPVLLNKIGRMYNMALILVENNDLGESVGNALWYDWEYDNLVWTHNEQIAGHGAIGVKTTRKVKSVGNNALKSLVENHQLILHDFRIIQELSVYVRQKKGLYGAQDTSINDDLISTAWLFGWLTQQTYFQDLTNNNVNQTIGKKFANEVDDYLPMGFYVDGINDTDYNIPYLNDDQLSLLK